MELTSSQQQAIELAKRLIIDMVWKTANIEVPGITFPDTQSIVEGYAPQNMPVTEIITVNNIKHAFQFLFSHVEYPVDWQTISHYNHLLREGLAQDGGQVRTIPVRMGGTQWIPPIPAYDAIREQIDATLTLPDPQERALRLFDAITRGQWFTDGNKRTALLVANHELIHAGVGILSIEPSARAQFASLLISYYETADPREVNNWLRENAIGFVPGGLTLTDHKRLSRPPSASRHQRR